MRRLIAVTSAIGLGCALLATAGPAQAGSAISSTPTTTTQVPSKTATGTVPVTPSTIAWGPCADPTLAAFGSVCGSLTVPLDHAKPRGKTVTLALSMRKHTVPDSQYQGIMLVNPGGPGGSGLIYSVFGDQQVSGLASAAAYDWIGFDPRGVGSSTPALSCDPNYNAGVQPSYEPVSAQGLATWLQRSKGYAKDCAKAGGALLDHVTTVDNARDMDSIREAMGQQQLNYYGFSYGTYLGATYSTLFPDKVRRQVLDSTVDPSGVWYRDNLDQDVAFDKVAQLWFAWIAQHDDVYHLGTTQAQVSDLWYATRAKLGAAPAGGAVGPAEWTDIFLTAGYVQFLWPDYASLFAAWVHDGDASGLVAENEGVESVGDDNGYAMYLATECSEGWWPKRPETLLLDSYLIGQQHPFMTWSNNWFNMPCVSWKAKTHQPVKIDGSKVASTLMVGETLDAATPFSGSLAVRKLFPTASLVATEGGTSHAVSLSGYACVDSRIDAYLQTGALPARKAGNQADVTCAATPLPEPNETSALAGAASGSSRSAPDVRALLQKELTADVR